MSQDTVEVPRELLERLRIIHSRHAHYLAGDRPERLKVISPDVYRDTQALAKLLGPSPFNYPEIPDN